MKYPFIQRAAKALVGAGMAGLAAALAAFQSGAQGDSPEGWLYTILAAFVTGVGVYLTTNKPNTPAPVEPEALPPV